VYIFTRKTSSNAFIYKLGFIHIVHSQCAKDLGVILDYMVHFLNHVDRMAASRLKRYSPFVALRHHLSATADTVVILYCTLWYANSNSPLLSGILWH